MHDWFIKYLGIFFFFWSFPVPAQVLWVFLCLWAIYSLGKAKWIKRVGSVLPGVGIPSLRGRIQPPSSSTKRYCGMIYISTIKLARSPFFAPAALVWPISEVLTGCPEAPDGSANPEFSSAGKDSMSKYINLECQWQNGKNPQTAGRTICASDLFDPVAAFHVRFWWGPGMCLTVPFEMGRCLVFDQIHNLFMLLSRKSSTSSWCTHTQMHTHINALYTCNTLGFLKSVAWYNGEDMGFSRISWIWNWF